MNRYQRQTAIAKKMIVFSWAVLGSYRGDQKYTVHAAAAATAAATATADVSRNLVWYITIHEPNLYVDRFIWAVGGALIYTFPVFLPFTVYHEITNLEKVLRNI